MARRRSTLLLAIFLELPAVALASPSPMAVLMAGPSCPDGALDAQLESGLRRQRITRLSHPRVAAALARTRAERALEHARQLYTRTDFPGCIALLSITEQELGRNLADPNRVLEERAHHLLARVNLWLGICQWAAGDPQTAAASFIRSAQLPSRPHPDPRLLPPEAVEAYRTALSTPRQEVTCEVEAPLLSQHLLIDGRPPRLAAGKFRLAAGTHYLALKVVCPPLDSTCAALEQRIGPDGLHALRLEASSLSCRVAIPAHTVTARITCASPSEARSAPFLAALLREVRAAAAIVVSVTPARLALRLLTRSSSSFTRQIVSQLEPQETPSLVVARSMNLLLAKDPPPTERPPRPWYKTWWIWALASAAVVATTATAVAATRTSYVKEIRMVFGP